MLNNASCFPEIAGDAALYFTFDSLAEKIEMALGFSNKERETLLSKQRERLTLYSWEKSARQLENVYGNLF